MKKSTFNEMVKLCRSYNPYTHQINSYTQQVEAQARNKELDRRFNELIQDDWRGYNRGVPVFFFGGDDVAKELEDWLWDDGDRGIVVE